MQDTLEEFHFKISNNATCNGYFIANNRTLTKTNAMFNVDFFFLTKGLSPKLSQQLICSSKICMHIHAIPEIKLCDVFSCSLAGFVVI